MSGEKTEEEKKPAFRRAYEKEQAEKLKTAQLFSVDDFISSATKTHEVYVPEIGGKVQYKIMDINETDEAAKLEGRQRSRLMLYTFLHKADPSVTKEKIGKMSDPDATAVLNAILADIRFLQQPNET